MKLGIEIGGTKLQLGLGHGDGSLVQQWRGRVVAADGAAGILAQIERAVPELLRVANIGAADVHAIGVGFGGPTDDATQFVVKSHHIHGWDDFPLARWLTNTFHRPAIIGNDADAAGLAEALHGAGRGKNPVFYITVGTGIGGGLIVDGRIYRGVGRGAAEIGHVRPANMRGGILEEYASGTGLGVRGSTALGRTLRGVEVAELALQGDAVALRILSEATEALGEAICTLIKLLCPARIIIGGGVSLLGEELFFAPIRRYVGDHGMQALSGLTDIVAAALGEDVVLHGAIALAQQLCKI